MLDVVVQDLGLTNFGLGSVAFDLSLADNALLINGQVLSGFPIIAAEPLDSATIAIDDVFAPAWTAKTASASLFLASSEIVPSDDPSEILDPLRDTAYVWGDRPVGDDTPSTGGGGRYVGRTSGDGGDPPPPPPPPDCNSPDVPQWTNPDQPTQNVDPSPALTITVNGNTITITGSMSFDGPGATFNAGTQYVNAINTTWTGQFGSYNVSTNISINSGGITAHLSESHLGGQRAELGGDEIWAPTLNGTDPNSDAYNMKKFAHEFGHILGLINLYDETTSARASNYENNIMNSEHALPNWQNIRDLLKELASGCG